MPQGPDLAAFGPEVFAAAANVSRETLAHLKIYAGLLEDWNARHNLVSRASMGELWLRHFWDSAQLAAFIPPEAKSLADLGSGAGFPGLVLAELFRERQGLRIVLFEATAKKCQFLAAVADRLKLAVEIRQMRIEDAAPEPFDVITARACAPLAKLFPYVQKFWRKNTVALLHKGQNVEDELTQGRKSWRMDLKRHASRSDPSGIILEIRELHRVAAQRNQSRH